MSDISVTPAGLAVQSALRLQQHLVTRLIAAGLACKITSVALVVLFFVMTRTGPTPSLWLLAPLGLLVVLDICCLTGIRAARKTLRLLLGELQTTAADKLKSLDLTDLAEKPLITGSNLEGFLWSLLSPSVWLYYGLLAVVTAQVPASALSGAHTANVQPVYSGKPSIPSASSTHNHLPFPGGSNNKLFPSGTSGQAPRPVSPVSPSARPVSPVPVPQPSATAPAPNTKQALPPTPAPGPGAPNPPAPKATSQPSPEAAPPKPEPPKPEASAK